jgi:hypothetical protein
LQQQFQKSINPHEIPIKPLKQLTHKTKREKRQHSSIREFRHGSTDSENVRQTGREKRAHLVSTVAAMETLIGPILLPLLFFNGGEEKERNSSGRKATLYAIDGASLVSRESSIESARAKDRD